jgi:flagellar motor protein MotB
LVLSFAVAKPKEPEKAPGWITTMSDMNTLLMVFFIMLFSLLSGEEPAYLTIEGGIPLKHMMPEGVAKEDEKIPIDKIVAAAVEVMESMIKDDSARETPVTVQAAQYARVARGPEGLVITVGGEFEAFEEGRYGLHPAHYRILDAVALWLRQRPGRVLIRGYTARNLEDSVVRDAQEVWRPWRTGDSELDADWHSLAYLRAQEAARYLGRLEPPVRPERITIQAEGAWGRRLGAGPTQHALDRRVEVVVLTDK